jgi:hypothetical protein
MKLLFMQFYPVSCYFLPRGSKYSPQYTLFSNSLFARDKISHPQKHQAETKFCMFQSFKSAAYVYVVDGRTKRF